MTCDNKRSPDDYFHEQTAWRDELLIIRKILTSQGLEETLKWGAPCYTRKGTNVVGIGAFKSYFGLWFYQGALLVDKDNVLINAQPGKTRALRQWRMHEASDIKPAQLRRYLAEAIELADSGKTLTPHAHRNPDIPDELKQALDQSRATRKQFEALRPGQQREYAGYIADAKRADTRLRRLEKVLPMIANGVGLNDRYR